VLDGVSFTIGGGKTLGIFGETGSGKSTIALLLARLYDPQEGRISIGGTNVREMDLETLRRGVGVVLQEPFLFSRTLEENIAITRENASRADVERAARDACLDASVGEFVNGYETIVGERGVTLSGGQKQRTAIARTLLSGAPVMVFDDSLSAVDTETDNKIRRAISERFGKATVILISHRVSTVSAADHIIVLDGGRISEHGTHDELRRAGGIYRRIYELQNMREEDGNDA
jgi:ATP-binding cassette subfamily B protein